MITQGEFQVRNVRKVLGPDRRIYSLILEVEG